MGGGAAHQSSLITVQQLEGVGELNSSNSSSARLSNGQQTSTWEQQQQQQEELSTTLPIAGAFTPFSHSRRSNQNFQQQPSQQLLQETEGSSSSPVKGYLSKENSFTAHEAGSSGGNSSGSKDVVKLSRENSCSGSGSAGDKERDGIAAVDSNAHLEQDEQAEHTLQRNRTHVDLDTAPSP